MLASAIISACAAFLGILGVGVRMILIGYRIARTLEDTIETVGKLTVTMNAHLAAHNKEPTYITRDQLKQELNQIQEKVDILRSDVRALYTWRLGRPPVESIPLQGETANGTQVR